jgi:hypothetical protein
MQLFILILLIIVGIFVVRDSIVPNEWYGTREIGNYSLELNSGQAVQIKDEKAYLLKEDFGLVILDISNPENPFQIGNISGFPNPKALVLSGDYCYVTGSSLMQIIDISDPTTPKVSSSYTFTYTANSITIEGDLLAIGAPIGQIHFLNVTNRSHPEVISKLSSVKSSNGILLENNFFYWADNERGLKIYDLNNPAEPILLDTYDNYGTTFRDKINAYTFEKKGDLLYLVDVIYGIIILNVSNPSEIVEVTRFQDGGQIRSIKVVNNHIICADFRDGVEIVDITELSNIYVVARFKNRPAPVSLDVKNQLIYIVSESGLSIIEYYPTNAPHTRMEWIPVFGYAGFMGFLIAWKIISKKLEKNKDFVLRKNNPK